MITQDNANKRFYNLDFLKFIFALEIIYFHLVHPMLHNIFPNVELYKVLSDYSSDGQKTVDFMFIIAGFVSSYSFKNCSVLDFIKKKICRLLPIIIISLSICLILNYEWFNLYNNIFSLFFLNNIGITMHGGNNGALWFLSVYFWVSLFYFFLRSNVPTKFFLFIVTMITWMSYVILIQSKTGNINGALQNFGYIFNTGMLRGLGGIGIGIIIYYMYIRIYIYKTKTTFINKCVYFLIEACLLCFLFFNMLCKIPSFNNDFIYVLAFVGLFWIFITHKGFLSYLFNFKISAYLANYSLCFFMLNLPLFHFFMRTLWKSSVFVGHEWLLIIISCLLVIVVSVFIYHLIESKFSRLLYRRLF